MGEPVRLGLTGDVMLGRNVDRRQRSRPPEAVWGDLLDQLLSLDGLVVNLECCLSTRGSPWTKTYRPFHFRADPAWAIDALDAAGVDACALANNHVLDYGPDALGDTFEALDAAGIAHAGAGRDLQAARRPAVFDLDGLSVGLLSFTDNTPEYAARTDSPGTFHVDIEGLDDRNRAALGRAVDRLFDADPDLAIASIHWGPNMRTEPPRAFRELARWLVDRGIDLVHGHSAHVFQGIEVVDGSPVLYDTGDFVDDYAVDEELRNDRGVLYVVELSGAGTPASLRMVPTEIGGCRVNHAPPAVVEWSLDRVRSLSQPCGAAVERAGDELVIDL